MLILIILRTLDVITNLLNINKWGLGVEGNPVMRMVMENGLFIPYQAFLTGLIIVIAELLSKYRRIIYLSISSISLLAVVNNLACFILIK